MNHDKLRELAQAATPGPYLVASIGPSSYALWLHDGSASHLVANRLTKDDAEFIAAAKPAVVLALLDELRDAKAKLADAWEEGKVAGASVNEGWEDTLTNPYQDIS